MSAPTYTISDLAREFGATARAIRFYEDEGILSPTREASQRVYSARDRTRLKLILRGRRLGLSLAEIRTLLDMYDEPKDTVPQLKEFLSVLSQHRQILERRREDIDLTLAEIDAQEAMGRRMLDQLKEGPSEYGSKKKKAGSRSVTA
ncbi:MerR family transcriptional regulator [Pigmentiphaga litoralis]|uniref:DNA-binding transcriptional MerR regulator n=1 Tax=Pigmentiphaga litoralis TaxID=516702 RepID=A0A7Y9IRM6_9BURK|nr:MerR family DNA-binding transcriptional regulator [Pigmentiphaga litoralis]NYE25093.1 DNA-binding transcriptional MerR regulator [Pigmentiphaga litoralis]NYE81293.1 DNA-binding transcriptional MerR regulator [Pigmentiphaga litoralis]